MPGSVVTTVNRADPSSVQGNIARCDTLGELLDLVPAPYRPSMQDLVNGLYRAAIKANNARSYLVNLEKHQQLGSFPTEIEGRMHSPSIQISKEFDSSAEWRSLKKKMDDHVRDTKKELLTQAIAIKRSELSHLQTLFAEKEYVHKVTGITQEVYNILLVDAAVPVTEDGTPLKNAVPDWIGADYAVMQALGKNFCSRTIALAYATVSRETTKKLRGLSLKQSSDGDVEMMDSNQRLSNVDQLVTKKVEQLLKEYKLSNNGKKQKGKKSPQPNPSKGSANRVSKAGGKKKKNGNGKRKGNSTGK